MILATFKQFLPYVAIFFLLVMVLSLTIIVLKRKTKAKKNNYSDLYEKILLIIGIDNILEVTNEQKRVRFLLKDIKKVDSKELMSLKIPAFVKGNELKLLIKEGSNEIYQKIKEKTGK